MGDCTVGDFSQLRAPGLYRAVLPGVEAWSYPFVVADGAFSALPPLFLDYVHGQRCGDFENELRGPCHLDDGVRSDTAAPVDAVGGWHDAGDLRKWMATTPLPIFGFFEARNRLSFSRNLWRERPHEDDMLAEAAWGLRWILKMQDSATGMFFEDVGGGGEGRGVSGGSSFTDNRKGSGDERIVSVQYNPLAQYINTTILLDAEEHFRAHYPAFSRLCRDAALRCWEFMRSRKRDAFHGWTSVISWRLLAALRLHAMGHVAEAEIAALVSVLLDLQSPDGAFWFMDSSRREPYRGIVNSAQPAIALAAFIENDYEHPLVAQARGSLERHWKDYVSPMLATNPFGIMPFGLFTAPGAEGDSYHPWGRYVYRFFMPTHSPQKVNHGLSSHWTSWAHGLAAMSRALERRDCQDAAFDQIAWLTGNNPLNVSMISGVGYTQAMPYSRFYGRLAGGFSVGPQGTAEDEIFADLDGKNLQSSGEYWMAPLANTLMALAMLLPSKVLASRKLGAAK